MPAKKAKSPAKRKKSTPKKSVSRSSKKTKASKQSERIPNFWENLSIDRRLDVIGIVLALVGLLTFLSLISAEHSILTGGLIRLLGQLFGWGVYILPIGLIAIGLWLVLRNLESIPAFSIERVTGVTLLYIWLLTLMHAIIAAPELAEQAAKDGVGGGFIGSLFEQALWLGFGSWGAIIAMIAWLLISLTMSLDVPIRDLFKWVGPLVSQVREALAERMKFLEPAKNGLDVQSNGYTPMQRAPVAVGVPQAGESQVGVLTTTSSAQQVIEYKLPAIKDILDEGSAPEVNEEFIQQRARLVEETLASFGAPAQVVEISRGPSITQFGVEPLFVETRRGRTRVRVNKISALADDLALALSAPRIRIQAPVPGRGFVGIEVPNDEMTLVALHDILESEVFQRMRAPMSFALGRDVAGLPQIASLDSMPHLLIAGTTGSGKSVCVNSILTSFLLHNTPDDLKLVLVDPKRVELTSYNGIPHLLAPVIVEVDRVVGALQWMTREMDKRYHAFAKIGARNIGD